MEPDLRRALARIARRHHGIVTREELACLGLSSETIDWALATAQLVRLFPGVYRVNGAPDTWHGRALAAQRRVERQLRRRDADGGPPPLAVIGGTAAAHLHDLPGHGRPPKLTVVTSRRCRSTAATIERRVALGPADVVEVERVPATSLAWTAVECAGRGLVGQRRDLVAHLVGTGRLRPAQLVGPAYRTLTLPGRGDLLRDLATVTGPVDHVRSRTECRLVDACTDHGLRAPALNHHVTTSDGATHELDLAWRDAMVDVEVDGPHHLLPSQRRRDRARDRILRADGWEVVRFPVEEVDDDPTDVAARVATILARRRPATG